MKANLDQHKGVDHGVPPVKLEATRRRVGSLQPWKGSPRALKSTLPVLCMKIRVAIAPKHQHAKPRDASFLKHINNHVRAVLVRNGGITTENTTSHSVNSSQQLPEAIVSGPG
jgi:hypothetical protein